MTGIIRDSIDGILDLVFPPRCLACDELDSHYICASCISKIEPVDQPYCERCGHTLIDSKTCRNCLSRERSFTKARAAGKYSGVLRRLVHEFKYGGARCLAEPLAKVIFEFLAKSNDFRWDKSDFIISVPIHPARRRVRGYNQSELLADHLSHLTGISALNDVIIRNRYTNPQVWLSREQRMVNMKDAFCVNHTEPIKDSTILLIDDVSTTSSTIHECSLELLKEGAARIYVVCLAFDA